MPSRSQLFAAGPAEVAPGTTCRICYEDMQDRHPLRLPCDPEHTFCKECITPWLLSQCKCMYMCSTPPWDAASWTDVDDSVIAKTAAQLPLTVQETFGTDEDETVNTRIMKWQAYLTKRSEPTGAGLPVAIFNQERTEIKGPGWAIPEQLRLGTVSLANAIPLLVSNSPKRTPYTAAEKQDWQTVIKTLLTVLPTAPAMVSNLESIPSELRKLTEGKLAAVGAIPFFQPDNVCHGDFELLLEYLALLVYVAPAPESLVGIARNCESIGQVPLLAHFALALML